MKYDISVIICTYNRCNLLKLTLQSLLNLKLRDQYTWELLVIDNRSTDLTKELVGDWMGKFQGRLRYFYEPNQGISYARNKGVQEAEGNIIVFTDDDCIIDKDWLDNIKRTFDQTGTDALGGRILPIYPPNTPQWVKDNIKLLSGPIVCHDYGEDTILYQKPIVEAFGANMSFKADVFRKCGLFRTDLGVGKGVMGEDTEFQNRIKQHGMSIYYCGKALVWHPVEPSRIKLEYLAKWNLALGRYRFIVDDNGVIDNSLQYIGGMPVYMIRQMLLLSFKIMINYFNKPKFLYAWSQFFIILGKARIISMRLKSRV